MLMNNLHQGHRWKVPYRYRKIPTYTLRPEIQIHCWLTRHKLLTLPSKLQLKVILLFQHRKPSTIICLEDSSPEPQSDRRAASALTHESSPNYNPPSLALSAHHLPLAPPPCFTLVPRGQERADLIHRVVSNECCPGTEEELSPGSLEEGPLSLLAVSCLESPSSLSWACCPPGLCPR